MRFDLETEVRFPNGERAGILRRVVLDQEGTVESVVLTTDDLISRSVIVPVSAFSEAPGNVLQINMKEHDLARLPEFIEELEPAVPEGWEFTPPDGDPVPGADIFPATMYEPIMPVFEVTNLPEGLLSLSQNTEIYCLDGRWGIVDEVLTDENGHATAFIGRSDEVDELDRVIPLALVSEYNNDAVILNCNIADLPAYTQELENEAEEPEVE
jgi:hypothetical protein